MASKGKKFVFINGAFQIQMHKNKNNMLSNDNDFFLNPASHNKSWVYYNNTWFSHFTRYSVSLKIYIDNSIMQLWNLNIYFTLVKQIFTPSNIVSYDQINSEADLTFSSQPTHILLR